MLRALPIANEARSNNASLPKPGPQATWQKWSPTGFLVDTSTLLQLISHLWPFDLWPLSSDLGPEDIHCFCFDWLKCIYLSQIQLPPCRPGVSGNRKDLPTGPQTGPRNEQLDPQAKLTDLFFPFLLSRWLSGSVTERRLVPGSGKSKGRANPSDYPSSTGHAPGSSRGPLLFWSPHRLWVEAGLAL